MQSKKGIEKVRKNREVIPSFAIFFGCVVARIFFENLSSNFANLFSIS
jgi:hypothetical protein